MVGGVGDAAVLAYDAGEVSAVGEVDGGFGGEAFEEAAGGGVVDFAGFDEVGVFVVEDEGVVVAGRFSGEGADVAADEFGVGKVEAVAGDGEDLAGGDEGGIHRGVAHGVEVGDVGGVVAGVVAAEIEVGVLGEVGWGSNT